LLLQNDQHLIEIFYFGTCLQCKMFIGIGLSEILDCICVLLMNTQLLTVFCKVKMKLFFADALFLNLTSKCVMQLFAIFCRFEQTYATSFYAIKLSCFR
ncbi:hypothetical protein T10_5228, partial [Trichinella papuae]